jgi:hypothetical protein
MRSKIVTLAALCLLPVAQARLAAQNPPDLKSVQLALANLQPAATFQLDGKPDWLAISGNAV